MVSNNASAAKLHKPMVVVGIPAYNSEKTIAPIIIQSEKYCDKVVVVNDGSTDSTAEIAKRVGANVINHERNLGYGKAIKSIFKQATLLKADILVTIDSDGQHDPAQIPKIIEPLKENIADVVLGSRFINNDHSSEMPSYRRFGIRFITVLSNGSLGKDISDAQSGFRAYNRNAIERLSSITIEGMSASLEILQNAHKNNLRICEVAITCKYKNLNGEKTSTQHPIKHGLGLLSSLFKLIIEDKPLTTLGVPGVISLIIGVLFGIWLINIYAIEHRIVTNVALASISFVLIGFFLVSTGMTLYAINRVQVRPLRNDE